MKRPTGFSLIELAIVLVVVALLLGGLLVPLTTQIEQQKIRETQKAMEEVKEALIGYAATHVDISNHPYLPCPDRRTGAAAVTDNNDGHEDRNPAGDCQALEGNVPWADLGVSKSDAWGNYFTYRVAAQYSNSSAGITLGSSPITTNIFVCENVVGAACTGTVATATQVPAVIISHGNNGFYAINSNFYRMDLPANYPTAPDATRSSPFELENGNVHGDCTAIPGDNTCTKYVSRTPSGIGSTAGEFDDLVTWLSPNILFSRMVAAGRLP
ncbi:MAG: prepilin-type N-terminal cleavage/methylation domain-containing protein [Sulfuricella sp.]